MNPPYNKLVKIKKGDMVKVILGKSRGKTGKVVKVFPKNQRVTVEGVNVYKKHSRPRRQGEKGEIINVIRPLQVSNLMLLCPSCSKPTRVGMKIMDDKKSRECKKCKAAIA